MLKRLSPALGHGQSLLGGEMGTIKKCFELQMPDGCVVVGWLAYDSSLGAAIKVDVTGSHGEDVIASDLCDLFKRLLAAKGSVEMETVELDRKDGP
jgi:hypothetical protein